MLRLLNPGNAEDTTGHISERIDGVNDEAGGWRLPGGEASGVERTG